MNVKARYETRRTNAAPFSWTSPSLCVCGSGAADSSKGDKFMDTLVASKQEERNKGQMKAHPVALTALL